MAISTKVQWGARKAVVEAFGLPQRQLNDFVDRGLVRVAKLGSCTQSPKLFCLEDVGDVLRALAGGKPLRQPVVGGEHTEEGEDEQ